MTFHVCLIILASFWLCPSFPLRTLKLKPVKRLTMQHDSRQRIDILMDGETSDEKAVILVEKFLKGEITSDQLMGPLFGVSNLTSEVQLPAGSMVHPSSAPDHPFLPSNSANNIELMHNIHPHDYQNPDPSNDYDIVVIGAGVAGLISVIIGSWLGKKCALIERHGMGGDCLNTGCVPSKALIACAREYYHTLHSLDQFGISIDPSAVTLDFGFVMERMRAIRAKISHHDSVSRYSREFCKHIFIGEAKFINENVLQVTNESSPNNNRRITFKKVMIATGASASVPLSIEGLTSTPHLTNANFFNLQELPPRMIVIGCGPIGLELAQSMRRFGTEVICIERSGEILSKEDPLAATVLKNVLEKEGNFLKKKNNLLLVNLHIS